MRRHESPRKFDSSIGSDTGTSTRESECSEDHLSNSLVTPLTQPESAKLFDSLAAELRSKLKSNGPPLLLPPRDYDTVHRAQGNLAAIELRRFVFDLINKLCCLLLYNVLLFHRKELVNHNQKLNTNKKVASEKRDVNSFLFLSRCRNTNIVGANIKNTTNPVVSSRGSSGIGSDLAPSPERNHEQTSSGK